MTTIRYHGTAGDLLGREGRGKDAAMIARRSLIALAGATLASPVFAQDFPGFLAAIEAEARRQGVSPPILRSVLAGLSPDPQVIVLMAHQPEFTLTWQEYAASVLTAARIAAGQQALAEIRPVLAVIDRRYGVDPKVLLGIWGIESGYGAHQGGFQVVRTLATLAWYGPRTSYFRAELLDALLILGHRPVAPAAMEGSYAGAMGQPQFMPSSYLHYAVSYSRAGPADIWNNSADSLASMANYLWKHGWRRGQSWGEPAVLPPGLAPGLASWARWRSLTEWEALGIERLPQKSGLAPGREAALLEPTPGAREAFLVYHNFRILRTYNPSDFYALAAGLLGRLAWG